MEDFSIAASDSLIVSKKSEKINNCCLEGKMSASAALLPCPVCLNSVFQSTETLRDRLIFVSTNKILCPICQEEVIGIDKLTIHLFSHVKLSQPTHEVTIDVPVEMKSKNRNVNRSSTCSQNKKPKTNSAKNKPLAAAGSPVKYVKIYPKLPIISINPVPILDISHVSVEGRPNVGNSMNVSAVKTEPLLANNKSNSTTCNLCGLQFVNSNILKMHHCLVHNMDENGNNPQTRYQCHICPKNFKMRGSLMVHMRVAHFGFSNDAIETNETKINAEANSSKKPNDSIIFIEKNDNKQWQCDVCRKCFTTKYFLKKHKRLHTGETPYACGQCNKTFTFQQSYHKHLLYHNDEKPHICPYCGRAFKELSTLHNHQRIHTGEKPFSCESCGKCFRQRVSYLVHRRIHTGVMPYKCTACDKSFRYKVSQRTHKCQAHPPGKVVRQTGELLEKLKKKHPDVPINSVDKISHTSSLTECSDISKISTQLVVSGSKLSLEDTEKDNFLLFESDMNEPVKSRQIVDTNNLLQQEEPSFNTTLEELISSIPTEDNNAPSPSEILKKLCLSSEQDVKQQETMNYQDFFKEFDEFL